MRHISPSGTAFAVGTVVALVILFLLARSLRSRTAAKLPAQAVDSGAFPVPPLPTAAKEIAPKEKSNA